VRRGIVIQHVRLWDVKKLLEHARK